MTLKPTDTLISMREWTEVQSPLSINYQEKIYQSDNGYVKVTKSDTYGNANVMKRRKWSKFGDAVEDSAPSIGADVFMTSKKPS